jgi:hypothetical protein
LGDLCTQRVQLLPYLLKLNFTQEVGSGAVVLERSCLAEVGGFLRVRSLGLGRCFRQELVGGGQALRHGGIQLQRSVTSCKRVG